MDDQDLQEDFISPLEMWGLDDPRDDSGSEINDYNSEGSYLPDEDEDIYGRVNTDNSSLYEN